MEQAAPKPSLWLAGLTSRNSARSDSTLRLQNASISPLPTGLLVAGTDESGTIHACNLKRIQDVESDCRLGRKYKLFLRYSLSVGAFGAPGDGEIWVGSQEVSRTLGQLCFIPGTRELVTFQQGSKKLLSVQLGGYNQEELESKCNQKGLKSERNKEEFGSERNQEEFKGSLQEDVNTSVGPDFRESFPVCCVGSCLNQLACITVREDGGAVAAADERGGVRLWAILDGQMLGELEAPDCLVNALAFGGSEVLVGASSDGAIRIWGLPEFTLLDSCTTLEKSPLVGLAVHWPDASRMRSPVIAAGAADGMLHVWEAVSEKQWELLFVADHALGEGSLAHLAFGREGTLLATCASGDDFEQRQKGPDGVSEEGNGIVQEKGLCPVRVYETERWGCLAEHSGCVRDPVLIQFVNRSTDAEKDEDQDAREEQPVLLLLSRAGSLKVIADPQTPSSGPSQNSGAPTSSSGQKKDSSLGDVPRNTNITTLGRLPQKRVSFAPRALSQRSEDQQTLPSARESASNIEVEVDGFSRQLPVKPEQFKIQDKAQKGSAQNEEDGGLAKEAQGKCSLVVLIDETEDGLPTPSPLPTRLANLVKAAPQKQISQIESHPLLTRSLDTHSSKENEPRHPSCYLSEPTLHSSARLISQLEQLRAQQFDTKAAIQSVAAGSRPAGVKAELAGLTGELSLGDFAKLGGGTHVTEQYTGLTPLEDEVPPEAVPRPVAKQVDARWQAALAEAPRLETLWVPEERRPQVCDVAPVYWPPSDLPDEHEEQSMATWSCLTAVPR